MNRFNKRKIFSYAAELGLYAVFVSVYLLVVFHFFGDWLRRLFLSEHKLYAFFGLLLICGQAVVLDAVTTALAKVMQSRRR